NGENLDGLLLGIDYADPCRLVPDRFAHLVRERLNQRFIGMDRLQLAGERKQSVFSQLRGVHKTKIRTRSDFGWRSLDGPPIGRGTSCILSLFERFLLC